MTTQAIAHPRSLGAPITPRITLAVASRVLTQLRRDHRTLAMLLVLPCLLISLLWWMFEGTSTFDLEIGRASCRERVL